jgi:hypothetical protein
MKGFPRFINRNPRGLAVLADEVTPCCRSLDVSAIAIFRSTLDVSYRPRVCLLSPRNSRLE